MITILIKRLSEKNDIRSRDMTMPAMDNAIACFVVYDRTGLTALTLVLIAVPCESPSPQHHRVFDVGNLYHRPPPLCSPRDYVRPVRATVQPSASRLDDVRPRSQSYPPSRNTKTQRLRPSILGSNSTLFALV